MWKEKVDEIRKRRERRNRLVNNGISRNQLRVFQNEVNKRFNYDLPKEYIDFLEIINGIDHNGLVLYGIDDWINNDINHQQVTGYIDTNEIWYQNEAQNTYLFFGDSNISWYCYDLKNKVYVELDKPSGELEREYQGFNEMIERALTNVL